MFLLLAQLSVKPDFSEDVESILRGLVTVAADEAGTVSYRLHRPLDAENAFILYELYADRAACDAHLQSAPVQDALRKFETMLVAPPQITFCETVASAR